MNSESLQVIPERRGNSKFSSILLINIQREKYCKRAVAIKAKGINNPGKNRPDTHFWQILSYVLKDE